MLNEWEQIESENHLHYEREKYDVSMISFRLFFSSKFSMSKSRRLDGYEPYTPLTRNQKIFIKLAFFNFPFDLFRMLLLKT